MCILRRLRAMIDRILLNAKNDRFYAQLGAVIIITSGTFVAFSFYWVIINL